MPTSLPPRSPDAGPHVQKLTPCVAASPLQVRAQSVRHGLLPPLLVQRQCPLTEASDTIGGNPVTNNDGGTVKELARADWAAEMQHVPGRSPGEERAHFVSLGWVEVGDHLRVGDHSSESHRARSED